MSDKGQEVQEKLHQLLEDESFAKLHPYLEQLQQFLRAQQYTPEMIESFVEIFQMMNNDIQAGKTVSDVLLTASLGQYNQPGWDVNTVNQSNGSIYQFVFNNFRGEADTSASPSIEIPIILLAMDTIELQELVSYEAFQGYPAKIRQNFIKFKKHIDKVMPLWQEHYSDTSELWKPFSSSANTSNIKSLVMKALKDSQSNQGVSASFNPSFKNIHTIDSDRGFLKQLRRNGCVIILDIISMTHPAILKAFHQSLLDAHPDNYVLVFTPGDLITKEVHKLTLALELCMSDFEFVKRYKDPNEEYYGRCDEISREVKFQQWLRCHLGEKINQETKDAGILSKINQFQ
jgi:hypothetical protein